MRKTRDVTIEQEGRDKGRVYRITEMPASVAERWAIRALTAASRTNLDIGNVLGLGMQGIAIVGVTALLSSRFEELEPLLDEMMACIKPHMIDGQVIKVDRPLDESDIEEVSTRLRLRREVLELHVGFSIADGLSNPDSQKQESTA